MKGFIRQKEYDGRESIAVFSYCIKNNIKLKTGEYERGWIPFGSVEWMESIIGPRTPEYYPEFLKDFLHRKVWKVDTWDETHDRPENGRNRYDSIFIKPSDRYKRFKAGIASFMPRSRVEPDELEYLRGPYWCSEIVNFKNEWRYYVANGEILDTGWYMGDDEDLPAPEFPTEIPKDYCGAIDMGMYQDQLTLVEAQHPYAIGWYGEDHSKYAEFLIAGWNYLHEYKIY